MNTKVNEINKFRLPEFRISLKTKSKNSELIKVSDVSDAAKIARQCFDADTIDWKESFIVIALNKSNSVVGFYKVSSGGVSATVADPKIIFQFALLANASAIIIAHNHPSGNLNPSKKDIDLTDKINKAGESLDIKLLDHIIVASEGYYSFSDYGLVN